jgi:hypothetical protein
MDHSGSELMSFFCIFCWTGAFFGEKVTWTLNFQVQVTIDIGRVSTFKYTSWYSYWVPVVHIPWVPAWYPSNTRVLLLGLVCCWGVWKNPTRVFRLQLLLRECEAGGTGVERSGGVGQRGERLLTSRGCGRKWRDYVSWTVWIWYVCKLLILGWNPLVFFVFFWGARFWGRGVDMSLFLTSLLLVLDQDANSMCCAVGWEKVFV